MYDAFRIDVNYHSFTMVIPMNINGHMLKAYIFTTKSIMLKFIN